MITVDDFGFHADANAVVTRAVAAHVPTHIGTMVNMPGSAEALTLLNSQPFVSLEQGLHFNLSESAPISDPASVPSLVNADGQFYTWAQVFRRAALGQIAADDVAREAEAQLNKLQKWGPINFFNSHHHVHLWPPIGRMLAPVIQRAQIRSVRHPKTIWWSALRQRYGFKGILVETVSQLHAPAARRLTQDFVDFDWIDPSDDARSLALKLVPVNAELACHPHLYTSPSDLTRTPHPISSLEWLTQHRDQLQQPTDQKI
jgi:predicted glycoside hydrolase/deacetylase ChbG (UPF0249 family)